jgi:hypothetical protein
MFSLYCTLKQEWPQVLNVSLLTPTSKYSKLDRGSFWWVSQLMAYIFNITPKLRELVEKTKKEIGFHGPIMAMQIRHGDSCVVRPDCKGLAEYMKHARVMKKKCGSFYLHGDKLWTPRSEVYSASVGTE